jgi:hypothetical protein
MSSFNFKSAVFTAVLAVCATLLPFAAAQASTGSGSALMEAISMYPPCALQCLEEFLPGSGCGATDVACLCTNVPFNANVTVCVTGGCTLYEQLATKNASLTMCGVEPRSKNGVAGAVAWTGYAVAIIVVGFRMCSLLPNMGRRPGWDDYTIVLTALLVFPPTLFATFCKLNPSPPSTHSQY